MRRRQNPYKRRRVDPFKSEAALCAAFMETARAQGLEVYPETSGWDMLVVDPGTGEQAGIEAKKRANVDVLYQALGSEHQAGPEVHAVLVPSASQAFARVAYELRIVSIQGWIFDEETRRSQRSYTRAPVVRDILFDRTPRWVHPGPAWVPEVQVDLVAGAPSPRSLTPWKMAAVRMALRLRETGTVTRREILDAGMGWALWRDRWLEPTGEVRNRSTLYRARPDAALPDVLYPAVAQALREAS